MFMSAAMAKEQEHDKVLIWMLADENLLAVLDKLSDRFDRQSWCMVCKKFLYLEAVSRNYVHLMWPEILELVLKRYRQVEHLTCHRAWKLRICAWPLWPSTLANGSCQSSS